MSGTLLRSSLNLTVAALWKTTLTSSSNNLIDDDDDGEREDVADYVWWFCQIFEKKSHLRSCSESPNPGIPMSPVMASTRLSRLHPQDRILNNYKFQTVENLNFIFKSSFRAHLSKIGASNIWESLSEAFAPFLITKACLHFWIHDHDDSHDNHQALQT